jgi:TolB protein
VIPFPLASGTPTPAVDVAEIIRGDLGSTGRFATIPLPSLPAQPTSLADVDFAQWRRAEVDFLVVGLVAIVHDGGHEVEFRLVDTLEERSVVGFVIPSAPDQLVGTAQKIARIIDDRLRPPSSLVAVD